MIRTYFILTLRHLLRHKTDTAVKTISLVLGITGCLFIAFFVQHEERYDSFHKNADRIYRVESHFSNGKDALSPRPLAEFMRSRFPEVQQAVRLRQEEAIIQQEGQLFDAKIIFTDSNFFSLFSFPLKAGNPQYSLSDPYQIVLTPEAADQYFGSQEVIGKTLIIRIGNNFHEFQIAALTEPIPTYTSVPFTILAPIRWLEKYNPRFQDADNWHTGEIQTFVKLIPEAEVEALEEKLMSSLRKTDTAFFSNIQYLLQPIQAIHLGPSLFGEIAPTTDARYLYLAAAAGLFLLIVACINFVTLSLGRSVNRAREVGVRKTLGAARFHLVRQFLGESFSLTFLVMIFSIVLAYLLLPYLISLLRTSITFNLWDQHIIVILLGILLITAFLSGLYPAWFLSGFSPVKVLKGQLITKSKNQLVSMLLVFQFVIASILLVGTVTMKQQLTLLQQKSLGFDDSQVIRIEVPSKESKQLSDKFRIQIASLSQVQDIAASWQLFGHEAAGVGFQKLSREVEGHEIGAYELGVGPNFLETMKIELLQGHFLPSGWNDNPPSQVIINESFAKAMGWENPLGKIISREFAYENAEVIGVVKDFHFLSLHQPIGPLVIHPMNIYTNLYVRVNATDLPSTIQALEKRWKNVTQEIPFTFHFLDEDIEQQYLAEQRWTKVITCTSVLIIVIACLGLFGMVTLITAQRTKEIGVRKVLGASVSNILLLLSKDFIKLILIALVIAIPIANYFITEWLQTFAYRIEIHWWMYAAPAILVLFIALFSVSGQILKAARHNPVDSLKYE